MSQDSKNIRVSREQHRDLKVEASKRGKTISDLVAEIIDQFFSTLRGKSQPPKK